MNKTSNTYILLAFLVFSIFAIPGRLQAEPMDYFIRTYDGGFNESARGVAVDRWGYVVVTGYSCDGNYCHWVTIEYDADANLLWIRTLGGDSQAQGVAVDRAGNVVVTGYSWNGSSYYDYHTIKYDPNGNELWTRTYDGGSGDLAYGVAVDRAGNVVVTGVTGNGDIHTIKYDPNGNELWSNTYDGGSSDIAYGVAVDLAGNVVVTGWSYNGTNHDCLTIKYDAAGNLLWTRLYDGGSGDDEEALGVAVDRQGNVVVTGHSYNGTNYDYLTVKYDPNGNELWTRTYDGGSYDEATEVAVDRYGNIVVTGGSTIGGTFDYYTIKYDPNGNELWSRAYDGDGGRFDMAMGVAVDHEGNVVVTGESYNGISPNYLTIKYVEDVAIDGIWTSDLSDNLKTRFNPGEDIRVHVTFHLRGAATTTYDITAMGSAFAVTGTFWEKRLGGQTLSGLSPGSYYFLSWDKKVPSTASSGSDAKIEIKIQAEALDATPYKLGPFKGKTGFKVR
ncbi:MAG: hypothetical protein HZA12_06910 [Nitrospirae bacterium]|nr:hypothetical protein [Nitrospirota bacterium]